MPETAQPRDVIDTYFEVKARVLEIFDYRADWVEIPLEDCRGQHWMLVGGEGYDAYCVRSDETFTLESVSAGKAIFGARIYTQRFLPRWVYRSSDYVLVSVDTQTDGNKFLMIFDADKECTDERLRQAYQERWG